MALLMALHLLDTSDEDSENDSVQLSHRVLRDSSNILELPTSQFVEYFRVSKDIFRMLVEKIQSNINTDIRPDIKLATFLRFLATGNYRHTVGTHNLPFISKSSANRIILEYLDYFESNICVKWIKMVRPENEHLNKQAFFDATGFPGVIGCVDGMHVKIKPPSDDIQHLYYNKKEFFSINAMMVCDHKTYIMYVDARHPGDNNDEFVWYLSHIDQILRQRFETGQRNTWILGDGSYKLRPYLMTPFRNPSNAYERRYNKRHTHAHNAVRRCFSMLKNRFRCIRVSQRIHYDHKRTTKIMNVCCAIHNMCLFYKCVGPKQVEERDTNAKSIRRNISLNL